MNRIPPDKPPLTILQRGYTPWKEDLIVDPPRGKHAQKVLPKLPPDPPELRFSSVPDSRRSLARAKMKINKGPAVNNEDAGARGMKRRGGFSFENAIAKRKVRNFQFNGNPLIPEEGGIDEKF